MNYCKDCKYFGECWNRQFEDRCIHPSNQREKTRHPVSGEEGFRMAGGSFTTEDRPLCTEIRLNVDDDCDLFEPKEVDAES